MTNVSGSVRQAEVLFPNSFSFHRGRGWICCLQKRDTNIPGQLPGTASHLTSSTDAPQNIFTAPFHAGPHPTAPPQEPQRLSE